MYESSKYKKDYKIILYGMSYNHTINQFYFA